MLLVFTDGAACSKTVLCASATSLRALRTHRIKYLEMRSDLFLFVCLFSAPNKNEAFEKLPKGLMSDLPSDCSLTVGDFIENTPQYFQH